MTSYRSVYKGQKEISIIPTFHISYIYDVLLLNNSKSGDFWKQHYFRGYFISSKVISIHFRDDIILRFFNLLDVVK